jgi:hypothetical protein
VRSSSGGISTIYLDGRNSVGLALAPEADDGLECCGGTEDCIGRERGCWDELMDDGELFDNEDPWLSNDPDNG